ncbi:MAG: nucleoside triphosphate pyrophosphohydrolase [Deltaproteobacteria bacterium]|nr:nucleoside triphosphate pyrophosphohydrolase [Deltaproteobacteria bacterium]
MAMTPLEKDSLEQLLEIMARLRGPQGCPWDRAQTHRSLIPYLVEETYEVVEAIEQSDAAALKEELGDLLLQVVFHAQLGAERGVFTFQEIAQGLSEKLVERHPHVFARPTAETTTQDEASAQARHKAWHARKMTRRVSHMDGIPSALPALQRAHKAGKNAAQSGFDWHAGGDILDKMEEELGEFRREVEALERAAQTGADRERLQGAMETELGDLLFAATQLARWYKIEPEAALRKATAKFMARFRWMEQALAPGQPDHQEGRTSQDLSPQEWEALWARSKQDIPD